MMKRTLFLCVCAATLTAACSTTPKADDADVTGSRSAGLIDVHEVVVSSPRGDGGFFTISEGGEVEVVDEGAPLAPGHYTTIAPDGAVTLADGSPFFTLNADGTLTAADGSLIPITIAEDGTTTNAKMSKPLVFDDAGNMSEEGIAESAAVAHVGGEDGPRARRAVALAFVSIFVYADKRGREESMDESMPSPAVAPSGLRGTGGIGGAGDTSTKNALEDEESADQM